MKISRVEKTYHDIKTTFEIAEGMKKDRFRNDFGYYEDTFQTYGRLYQDIISNRRIRSSLHAHASYWRNSRLRWLH